jgi:hypothetical protein
VGGPFVRWVEGIFQILSVALDGLGMGSHASGMKSFLFGLLWVMAGFGAGWAADEEVKPVMLFDGKSLDDWEMVDIGASGYVELEEDKGWMLIRQGDSLSGAIYKKTQELPLERYEITLEAMRQAGVDFFCGLTFPIGKVDTCATLILGGWGGSVTGISSIDGMDASNNATGTYQRFEDDKWYKVRLRVTPENLSAWIDDKQVVDIDIAGRKVGLRPGPIESYAPLALSTFNTAAAIKNVKFTPLTKEK